MEALDQGEVVLVEDTAAPIGWEVWAVLLLAEEALEDLVEEALAASEEALSEVVEPQDPGSSKLRKLFHFEPDTIKKPWRQPGFFC